MNKKKFDVIVIFGLSILFLIFYMYFPGSLLNTLLGLPFVLIFPGYALVSAVYRTEHNLALPQRLALSCVISLTIVTILAIGLNAIGYLSTTSQILGIELIIIVSCIVVLYRRFHRNKGSQFAKELGGYKVYQQFNSIWVAIVLVVVFIIFGIIINLIMEGQAPTNTTAFYLLGAGGKAGNYPAQVNLGSPFPITIGIINNENEPITYHVDLQIDQRDPESLATVVLNPGEKWEQSFDLLIEQANGSEALVGFYLHKGSAGEVYRSLHFWVQIVENDLVSHLKKIMHSLL